jgi:intracellular multiplication protein IcmL
VSEEKSSKSSVDLVREGRTLREKAYKQNRTETSRLISFLTVSVGMNLFLIWLAFVYFPQSEFVPTANAAAICKITPINAPHIPQQVVADFAVEAALGIYSYDHANYRKQITGVTDRYFTPEFRDDFMVLFGNSVNLKSVIENFYVVSSTTAGNPAQIKESGINGKGAFYWKVQVPLIVYYISGRKRQEEKVVAEVTVTRVDPWRLNPRGIAVSNIVTRQRLN